MSGNKIFVIGGWNQGQSLPDVDYSVITTTGAIANGWSQTQALDPPRAAHAAVEFEGRIYVIGGSVPDPTNHANLVADRIIQLGGDPVLNPQQWFDLSPCAYDTPEDPYVSVLLEQNIAGEQCAISAYKNLMDATKDKDMVTYNMALTILEQEVEHEEDLQSLLEDLELMVGRGMAPKK